ncbi:MAG: hypothetical protein PHP37_01390 [Patescibacteria group bacterium]|nr:hypothetical protein [Patescibacteria group bacterium]
MEQLASITILTTNRQKVSSSLNNFLTKNGHLIMARLGVNITKTCIENCPGMIVLVLKAKKEDIAVFITGLEKIEELEIKTCFFEEK